MNYKAGIIIVNSGSQHDIDAVQTMLTDTQVNIPSMIFEPVGNSFYIGTEFRDDARQIRDNLNTLNIDYAFFRLGISTGSNFDSKGIDPNIVKKIKNIFFED